MGQECLAAMPDDSSSVYSVRGNSLRSDGKTLPDGGQKKDYKNTLQPVLTFQVSKKAEDKIYVCQI